MVGIESFPPGKIFIFGRAFHDTNDQGHATLPRLGPIHIEIYSAANPEGVNVVEAELSAIALPPIRSRYRYRSVTANPNVFLAARCDGQVMCAA